MRPIKAPDAKLRRDTLAAAGLCINGDGHQRPKRGTKCEWCRVVHRIGVLVALERASADSTHPQPPPGTRRGAS